MITNPEILQSLLQGSLSTKEEMLEAKKKKGELFIGIPKEISFQERRVALVPEAVCARWTSAGAATCHRRTP